MPSATTPSLSEEEVDDLIYLARVGDLQELLSNVEALAKSANSSQIHIISGAIDDLSGNGILHMASANGHTDILKHLIILGASAPTDSPTALLNIQNTSGNTPLHWASLIGHLEAVKTLVGAGADPTITNKAGHDALYEAEINGKYVVVEWLLTEGKGLETGVKGGQEGDTAEDVMQEQIETSGVEEDRGHFPITDAP